ncbi:MAG: ROK family protein [Ruminococcaceae bacterium]|nr:ROK family protein [Oscillospiraceae bacterium]
MIKPVLDHDFIPARVFNEEFLKTATRPFTVAVEREDSLVYRVDTFLGDDAAKNRLYAERLIKFLLWSAGGWKIMMGGDHDVYEYIKEAYTLEGLRAFDVDFWSTVYDHPFTVEEKDPADIPQSSVAPLPIGRHLDGCRVGFDAGGSDIKVASVVNGEVIFSQEIVWNPKITSDINYHYEQVRAAIELAASKMERCDAVGVSSAGVIVKSRPMQCSLFMAIPKDTLEQKESCRNIYLETGKKLGIPMVVANDGDIAALAASMALDTGGVMGIAMGTSEAAGYVDTDGHVTGWQNELAFAPVDYNTESLPDDWSGDYGVGAKYFSQDAVIKLAPAAGIELDENLTPAEKLKVVQGLLAEGHRGAEQIFETIGTYFGYSVAHYSCFYDIRHLQISGRVTSGRAGGIIIEKAREVLEAEYPDLAEKINMFLPDEYDRRIGQAVAAASLVAL